MEHDTIHTSDQNDPKQRYKPWAQVTIVLFAATMISLAILSTDSNGAREKQPEAVSADILQKDIWEQIAPATGTKLPVRWGDLGAELVRMGAIDRQKMETLYRNRGDALNADLKKLLDGGVDGRLIITRENAPLILNLFWALGLANANPILVEGPMTTRGDTENFASTGGWTLAQGSAMGHYGKHTLVILTAEQQALVERVSKGVYRPCCDNPTYFPDCNHGMAMLGFLELMASQGASEADIYRSALILNSYWFTGTYATIAQYFGSQGIAWSDVDPRVILGKDYSSASGYANIASKMQGGSGGGGSCGV